MAATRCAAPVLRARGDTGASGPSDTGLCGARAGAPSASATANEAMLPRYEGGLGDSGGRLSPTAMPRDALLKAERRERSACSGDAMPKPGLGSERAASARLADLRGVFTGTPSTSAAELGITAYADDSKICLLGVRNAAGMALLAGLS